MRIITLIIVKLVEICLYLSPPNTTSFFHYFDKKNFFLFILKKNLYRVWREYLDNFSLSLILKFFLIVKIMSFFVYI
jgi:hypothetical protein